MVDHRILVDTAALYARRSHEDERYLAASGVLNDAVRRLGLTEELGDIEIQNAAQFVVVRTRGARGEAQLVEHPLDLVESWIAAGIETLRARGLVDAAHTCLIAVPRGSLTVTFTFIYEVVRRCGWSVLPLGGSSNGHDISELCSTFGVDTLVLAADAIDAVFDPELAGRFDGLRRLLHVSGLPSSEALDVLATRYPRLEVAPFLYLSEVTGPIAVPTPGRESDAFDVLDHVLIEVNTKQGEIALNGSGDILVTVLGLAVPTLVRRRVGDHGVLTTSEDGHQVVELRRPSPP